MKPGSIFLIPVPLAEDAASASFTPYLTDTINQIDEYIAENPKTARKFLKQAGLKKPLSEILIHDYGKHNRQDISSFFTGLLEGRDVGLMSEAGCPGVADPGSEIVAYAHQKGIRVVPLVGPSSILLSLMASGFSGQSFAFHGYLPIDKAQRAHALKELELTSEKKKQTQIFIETPFRNNQLFDELIRVCRPDTRLCIAVDLTSASEQIEVKTLKAWKSSKTDLHKRPAIFLLSR